MAQQTSDHIEPCNIGQSEAHNRRSEEYLAHINKEKIYVRLDLIADNESWTAPQMEGMDLPSYYDFIARMVKEKTGRALQKKERSRIDKKTGKTIKVSGSSPIRESVVVCKTDTTMEELKRYCDSCCSKWGITALQIHIHKDEGHYTDPGDKTTWKPNYHAHIVWDWMNHVTGKSLKLGKEDMSLMQDFVAGALGMERGTSKAETGKAHLERNDYIVAKQKREAEQAISAKAVAEASRDAAQWQLKQVKGEINTQKMKGAAVNATTAIADSVSSLLGGSKVKRLEAENGQLRQGIANLKQQIIVGQAEKKKSEVRLHREMNTQERQHEKEIMQYNDKLEQIDTYFPNIKELLPIADECKSLGFTKEMIKTLVNFQPVRFKGKLYSKEYDRKFEVNNATATIEKNSQQKEKFHLCINGMPLLEWFKKMFQELTQALGIGQKTEEPPKRGLKI